MINIMEGNIPASNCPIQTIAVYVPLEKETWGSQRAPREPLEPCRSRDSPPLHNSRFFGVKKRFVSFVFPLWADLFSPKQFALISIYAPHHLFKSISKGQKVVSVCWDNHWRHNSHKSMIAGPWKAPQMEGNIPA